jgi:hypothetical protein
MPAAPRSPALSDASSGEEAFEEAYGARKKERKVKAAPAISADVSQAFKGFYNQKIRKTRPKTPDSFTTTEPTATPAESLQAVTWNEKEESFLEIVMAHGWKRRDIDPLKAIFTQYSTVVPGSAAQKLQRTGFQEMLPEILDICPGEVSDLRSQRLWRCLDEKQKGGVEFEEFFIWYLKYIDADRQTAQSQTPCKANVLWQKGRRDLVRSGSLTSGASGRRNDIVMASMGKYLEDQLKLGAAAL